MYRWVIGVDLGGTLIRAMRADLEGRKQARSQLPTEAEEGPEKVMERIFATIEEVLEDIDSTEVAGIGIGAPGPIDHLGRLHDPPNLPGWNEFSLSERVAGRFGMPAVAGNDANLAALGEHRLGAGTGVDDLVYMTISTGIGGGIISGGRLVLGARGFAAEVGHQTLEPGGPICSCGQPGHLEALAAGPSIAREAIRRIEGGAQSSLSSWGTEITAKAVTKAAKEGDALALELLVDAGFYIGLGLVNLIHILEPERILIGGGVSQAGDLLLEPVRETVWERVMSPIYRVVEILPAGLGGDVGLVGAVALALAETQADESASS